MFEPGKRAFCLVVLLLTGCATQLQKSGPAEWHSDNAAPPPSSPSSGAAAQVLSPESRPSGMPRSPVSETWVPLDRWCHQNGLASPARFSLAPQPGYSLTMADGPLALHVGSLVAHWAGLDVWLAFPPQMVNGQPYVHALDLEKTLEPLTGKAGTGFLRAGRSIVIDPGHGGTDAGTSSVLGRGLEKDFTLDWAQRLGHVLAGKGWQVWLTRGSDVNLGLPERVAVADARQAELFVSLHFNSSAPDHEQSGLETYCLTPAGLPSSVTRGFSDELTLVCPNNAFDAENLQLALRVHRALLEVNGHHDRGVRRARFPAVLRGQDRPAILIEGGYLSNPHEARLIADPVYRQKLAEAVAAALEGEARAQQRPKARELSASQVRPTTASP